MQNTLNIATDGYLFKRNKKNTLSIASNGYIYFLYLGNIMGGGKLINDEDYRKEYYKNVSDKNKRVENEWLLFMKIYTEIY
jgi:hypothetical protein